MLEGWNYTSLSLIGTRPRSFHPSPLEGLTLQALARCRHSGKWPRLRCWHQWTHLNLRAVQKNFGFVMVCHIVGPKCSVAKSEPTTMMSSGGRLSMTKFWATKYAKEAPNLPIWFSWQDKVVQTYLIMILYDFHLKGIKRPTASAHQSTPPRTENLKPGKLEVLARQWCKCKINQRVSKYHQGVKVNQCIRRPMPTAEGAH